MGAAVVRSVTDAYDMQDNEPEVIGWYLDGGCHIFRSLESLLLVVCPVFCG